MELRHEKFYSLMFTENEIRAMDPRTSPNELSRLVAMARTQRTLLLVVNHDQVTAEIIGLAWRQMRFFLDYRLDSSRLGDTAAFARNPLTPPSVLLELAELASVGRETGLAVALLGNPSLPPDGVELLSHLESNPVLALAALHENADYGVLLRLAVSESSYVRNHAVHHPKLAEIYDLLVREDK